MKGLHGDLQGDFLQRDMCREVHALLKLRLRYPHVLDDRDLSVLCTQTLDVSGRPKVGCFSPAKSPNVGGRNSTRGALSKHWWSACARKMNIGDNGRRVPLAVVSPVLYSLEGNRNGVTHAVQCGHVSLRKPPITRTPRPNFEA